MTANPWNLTPRECDVMDAIVQHGCNKAAARALGITKKTVELHLYNIVKKMPHSQRLLRAIAWDRWRREGVRT